MPSNKKILIIDDEPHLLRATARLLRTAGYEVSEASTGLEGLRLAQALKPDLILLDVVLPDLNGLDLCRRLKSDHDLLHTFVVMLSSIKTSSEEQALGLEHGADGYIVRPLSNRELLARVESTLRLKQAEDELRRYRDQLEALVEARTAELVSTNQQLRQEIDQRIKVEQALRASETQFRQLAETIEDAFWIGTPDVGQDRRLIYVSPAFEKIFGISPEVVYQSDRLWLESVHEADRERVLHSLENFLTDQGSYHLEYRIIRPNDGHMRWILARGFAIRDEQGQIYRAVGLAQDITGRKGIETALETALAEKEGLLREIHHRVKNNLQIVSSILQIQADSLSNQEAINALDDSHNRIRTMALIHERLYQSEHMDQIDLTEYIRELIVPIFRSYRNDLAVIRLRLDMDEAVVVDLDKAIPCGLIINELVTNALKYAFPAHWTPSPDQAERQITVSLRVDNEHQVVIAVRDNGVGFPSGFELETAGSFGLQLVQMFTRQLEGALELEQEGTGTAMRLSFSL